MVSIGRWALVACLSWSVIALPLAFIGGPVMPPINKWGFYGLCQHGYDPFTDEMMYPLTTMPGGMDFEPDDVKPGDAIFLRARCSVDFFAYKAPFIKVPYIIVSHGEYLDAFLDSYRVYLEDPRLIAWFGTHPCMVDHPKFMPIPLGIPPRYSKPDLIKGLQLKYEDLRRKKKSKLLYVNFSHKTHPERNELLKFLKGKSFCSFQQNVPYEQYIKEIAEHKFTLSPRGLGPDCYRTWEALLLGSIPIVKRSNLHELYKDLPILIVDDWNELTLENLTKKYHEICSCNYDIHKLYMDYWCDVIVSTRMKYFEQKKLSTLESADIISDLFDIFLFLRGA